MNLDELEARLRQHQGEFLCECIGQDSMTKRVRFAHVTTPADAGADLPADGRLAEFYARFGSVLFYHDETSGDAARYLAPVSEWATLREDFDGWIFEPDDEDLPDWLASCLVIGETPQSGNYILFPTEGEAAGQVFEFDHDGMEFQAQGRDVVDYVARLLEPDNARLTDFASHLRFIEADQPAQWWIRSLSDNRGHTAHTEA